MKKCPKCNNFINEERDKCAFCNYDYNTNEIYELDEDNVFIKKREIPKNLLIIYSILSALIPVLGPVIVFTYYEEDNKIANICGICSIINSIIFLILTLVITQYKI